MEIIIPFCLSLLFFDACCMLQRNLHFEKSRVMLKVQVLLRKKLNSFGKECKTTNSSHTCDGFIRRQFLILKKTLYFSVRPCCTVRVRPKIIAVRCAILLLHFLVIFRVLQMGFLALGLWITFSNLNSVPKKPCFASHFPNNKVLTRRSKFT